MNKKWFRRLVSKKTLLFDAAGLVDDGPDFAARVWESLTSIDEAVAMLRELNAETQWGTRKLALWVLRRYQSCMPGLEAFLDDWATGAINIDQVYTTAANMRNHPHHYAEFWADCIGAIPDGNFAGGTDRLIMYSFAYEIGIGGSYTELSAAYCEGLKSVYSGSHLQRAFDHIYAMEGDWDEFGFDAACAKAVAERGGVMALTPETQEFIHQLGPMQEITSRDMRKLVGQPFALDGFSIYGWIWGQMPTEGRELVINTIRRGGHDWTLVEFSRDSVLTVIVDDKGNHCLMIYTPREIYRFKIPGGADAEP